MNKDRPSDQRLRDLAAHYANRCATCGVKRCRAHRARRAVTKPVPYGYVMNGDVAELDHEVVREIRTIFEVYVRHRGSMRCVLAELGKMDILSPKGKSWHRDTLLRVIRDSTYGGNKKHFPAVVACNLAAEARKIAAADKRKFTRPPKRKG